jgi:hypothetical protein
VKVKTEKTLYGGPEYLIFLVGFSEKEIFYRLYGWQSVWVMVSTTTSGRFGQFFKFIIGPSSFST